MCEVKGMVKYMNYYGNGVYCADLLVAHHNVSNANLHDIEEKVRKTKKLMPIREQEEAMALFLEGGEWIAIDCDSVHQQINEFLISEYARIWEAPVIVFDIFDEDVIILGYGNAQSSICKMVHSDDSLIDTIDTAFPMELMPYFQGNEAQAQEIWSEEYVFGSAKIHDLFELVTHGKIYPWMVWKNDLARIPKEVKRIYV